MEQLPQFEILCSVLEDEDLSVSPSELQGRLSAQLAINPEIGAAAWVRDACGEKIDLGALPADLQDMLEQLYHWTADGLNDPQLGFDLYLPDDDEPLQSRTEALATWCEGFVAALGQSGVGRDSGLSGDAGEYLDDLSEISLAEFGTDGGEDDENAFAELVEYARVGAMLIFATLHGPAIDETLH